MSNTNPQIQEAQWMINKIISRNNKTVDDQRKTIFFKYSGYGEKEKKKEREGEV